MRSVSRLLAARVARGTTLQYLVQQVAMCSQATAPGEETVEGKDAQATVAPAPMQRPHYSLCSLAPADRSVLARPSVNTSTGEIEGDFNAGCL